MPLDPSQELHLQETDLDDAGNAALRELSKWVNEEAIFVATGEIAKVQDDGRKTRCEPFFKAICQHFKCWASNMTGQQSGAPIESRYSEMTASSISLNVITVN